MKIVYSKGVDKNIVQGWLDQAIQRITEYDPVIGDKVKVMMRDGGWTLIMSNPSVQQEFGIRGFTCRSKRTALFGDDQPAIMAHELTHMIGGNEIDAEGIENLLYATTEGATLPDDLWDRAIFERANNVGMLFTVVGKDLVRDNTVVLRDFVTWEPGKYECKLKVAKK